MYTGSVKYALSTFYTICTKVSPLTFVFSLGVFSVFFFFSMVGKRARSELDTEDEFDIEYYKSSLKKVREKLIRILDPLLPMTDPILILNPQSLN